MATAIGKRAPSQSWISPPESYVYAGAPDMRMRHTNDPDPIFILEENDSYRIEMTAPGLQQENITIEVDGPVLTIIYEHETEKAGNSHAQHTQHEYNYSCFSRSMLLPENADGNKISARYYGGALQLFVQKKRKAA